MVTVQNKSNRFRIFIFEWRPFSRKFPWNPKPKQKTTRQGDILGMKYIWGQLVYTGNARKEYVKLVTLHL